MSVSFLLRIEHDLVRERIGIASGDWWYVVLVAVHDSHDLHRCLLQRTFHGSPDFDTFWYLSVRQQRPIREGHNIWLGRPTSFRLRSGNCNFNQPLLPHDFLIVGPSDTGQPSALPPLLVEELYGDLSTNSSVGCIRRRELVYQSCCARINERLKLRRVCDVRQSDVKVRQITERWSD